MTETARARRRGPDRLSVALFSLTAFLLVLALMGTQIAAPKAPPVPPRPVIVRRIYVTTVVEKVPAGVSAPAPHSTVTQTSTPAPAPAPSAPVSTRASGAPVG